ncbi:DUF2064 domain-containing protein [Cellulophaga baltica]|uniref:TIGR04282 family arsenosugar biosynthesis glycosyltransferase n=1 Tax=Cellulophaga TaxID=104264 RepID=UPI001C068F63|nr:MULTISPECIES: DUF2064 domain-containing protein [Cellulophaga]MBU2995960.1 DUF2064 domain-containing protein [Cellulophaga baltica]MDO6767355.1 DUF2064 domain-containing protein [Cellulophaga sp. 1_MG-2023]
MIPNNNKTVLFVFSLSASIEAERKPIFGSNKKKASKKFFNLLNQKTLNVAKESGVDVVLLDETKQKGSTFSERYFNAYKTLFDKGYEKVISIGNDTPNLTSLHIKKAIWLLSNQDIVFGPSKDGGVYLLGFNKSTFDEKAFKNFSWLTSNLSREIRTFALKSSNSLSILETLSDIDSKNNALEFAYSNSNSTLASYILDNFNVEEELIDTAIVNVASYGSLNTFSLRGPPTL